MLHCTESLGRLSIVFQFNCVKQSAVRRAEIFYCVVLTTPSTSSVSQPLLVCIPAANAATHTAAESRASTLEAKLTALEQELSQAESSQNDTVRALARQKEEQVNFNYLHLHYFKFEV
jgi:hypothetical protein